MAQPAEVNPIYGICSEKSGYSNAFALTGSDRRDDKDHSGVHELPQQHSRGGVKEVQVINQNDKAPTLRAGEGPSHGWKASHWI